MESTIRVSMIEYLGYTQAVTFDFGSTRDKCVQNRICFKPDNVEINIL
jgi:hypothetical protein